MTTALIAHRVEEPSDGTVVQVSNRLWQSDRLVIDRVLDASTGLRAGDQVVAVNGRPLSAYADGFALVGWPHPGVTYTISRGESLFDIHVRGQDFPLTSYLLDVWPALTLLTLFVLVAGFVFVRRPNDAAARDLLLIAVMMTGGTTGWLVGDQVSSLVARGPSAWHLVAELQLALIWGVVGHFLLAVAGHTRSGPAGYAVCLAVPIALYGGYLAVALPQAADAREVTGRLVQVSLPASTVLPAAAALLLVRLYLRADDEPTRKSLRLLLVSLAFAAVVWPAVWTVPSWLGLTTVDVAFVPVIFLPALLALITAIVQQRLLDIEVVLTRSLIYATVLAAAVALYVAVSWRLNERWGSSHVAAVLFASGLLAMLVPPLVLVVSRRLSRVVFGVRHDPLVLVNTLGGVSGDIDRTNVLGEVATLLAESLRLAYAEITVGDRDGHELLSSRHGQRGPRAVELPLTNGSTSVGRLVLEAPGHRSFTAKDVPMMRTLQRQISGLATNLLLTQEVLQSRDRIVRAREEERRQLHHRLHDGLGASLAAATMQLDVARRIVTTDPARAEATLAHLGDHVRELIADLRGLIYGLRPPALDQIGLPAAIRSRAEEFSTLPASPEGLALDVIEDGDFSSLPAAVEVAAYWIAVEATHNVVKHARASKCLIELKVADTLEVYVDDDGRGVPTSPRAGGGLSSMSERAEELGGTVTLTMSSRYGGARLHARLPLAPGGST